MADTGGFAERIDTRDEYALDELDHHIVAALRRDGRRGFKSLAEDLKVTESTVRARIRRLEDSRMLRVVAVTDSKALGYDMLLSIGLQVEGRAAESVAVDLVDMSAVFSVCQVVGNCDIEALVVARDQTDLSDLLERLAAIPGVRRVEPSLALDVLKNQPNWVPFGNEA